MASQPPSLFYLPFRPALDANGIIAPGARLFFYLTQTSIPQKIYADAGLSVELENPVGANAAGIWPSIYMDPALTYRVVLRDQGGVILNEVDPYAPGVAGEQGPEGPTGPANSTYTSMASLKAAPQSNRSYILADGTNSPVTYAYVAGDFTGRADDVNVVKLDAVPLTTGALVRQSAKSIAFRGQGAPAVPRSAESKNRDIISFTDALTDSIVDATRGLSYTADVAPVLQAALNALAARGGGTLFVPAGRYYLRSTVVIPANVSIQGDGMGWIRITGPTKGTEFYISHNGHGFRTIAPINSYTPSCNTLRDFAMYCESPNAHVGGMIYDQGGSYMRYERLFIQGGQYGAIWDQTEQSDIDGCIFQEQKHSGVWLVNGNDMNADAVLGFTNRLAIRNCEFNQQQKFGILDDGGLSHDFISNNYNGCVIAAIRCAGFCNTNVIGGEIEYSGTADLIIARKSFNAPVRDVGAMQTVKLEGVFTTGGLGPGIIIEDAGLGPQTVLAALDVSNNHWRGTSGPLIKGGQYAVEINTRGNVLGAGYTSYLEGRPGRFHQAEGVKRTTAAWTPPATADGGVAAAQFAFPNVRISDKIDVSFSAALGAGADLYASVPSPGVVAVTLRNDTGSGYTPGAGTLYLTSIPQEPV